MWSGAQKIIGRLPRNEMANSPHPAAYQPDKPSPYLSPQELAIGERPVGGVGGQLGAKHMGIKLGNTWYEVTGEGLQQVGSAQTIQQGSTPTQPFLKQIKLGDVTIPPKLFQEWIGEWSREHGSYNLWDNNCQQFVIDMARRAGLSPPVRNQAEPVVKLFSPLSPRAAQRIVPTPTTPPTLEEVAEQSRKLRLRLEEMTDRAIEMNRQTEAARTPSQVIIPFSFYHAMSKEDRERLLKIIFEPINVNDRQSIERNRAAYRKLQELGFVEDIADKMKERQIVREERRKKREPEREAEIARWNENAAKISNDLNKANKLMKEGERDMWMVDKLLQLVGWEEEVRTLSFLMQPDDRDYTNSLPVPPPPHE